MTLPATSTAASGRNGSRSMAARPGAGKTLRVSIGTRANTRGAGPNGTGSVERSGDGLEVRDELVELVRLQAVVRRGGEVVGTRETGGVDAVAEDPPQRCDAALLACGERRRGSGRVPDAGDVAGDLAVGEAVEDRMDDLGRDAAQRRGPSGEVAVPVVPVAERPERIRRLRGEVGGRVAGAAGRCAVSSRTPTSRGRFATAGPRGRARGYFPGAGRAATGTRVGRRPHPRHSARQHVRP